MRFYSRILFAACAAALVTAGCDQSLDSTETLTTLDPASLDADAGTWRLVVLTSPSQVAVPAPFPVASPEYQAELARVAATQAALTPEQREALETWGGGGVLRWNQIARGLVARFSVPPAPLADGTYPVPDPDNPFADPQLPFANPPYAARAYSYLSVAQAEALKAAWHYKFLYNRPSPARVGGGVQALLPVSDLPAYPSEDAVLSGVSAEVLKVLFPSAVEDITRAAAEQRLAALASGRATASDVAAGLALGKSVAAALLARASTDGMRAAPGTPALWQSYLDATEATGEVAWRSQDLPARPPMLAGFGAVRTWTMTPAEVLATYPPPPPSTSSQQMRDELAEVKRTVDNLTRDQLAVAQRWNDGAGTYTPPGHWNDIAAEHVRDARMSEVRAARTFALLNMALHDSAVACWGVKYRFFNPRPSQLDPSIRTAIGLPNFPAYPSGHSTFSSAAAAVLTYVFPEGGADFARMSDEAGISRLYGGIHYRSDIDGGKAHGQRVGAIVVQLGRGDGAD